MLALSFLMSGLCLLRLHRTKIKITNAKRMVAQITRSWGQWVFSGFSLSKSSKKFQMIF